MIFTEDSYHIWLKTQAGDRIAYLDSWESLHIERQVNKPGAYVLQLRGDDERCDLFLPDCQIEVWRTNPDLNIPWYLEFEGFHEDDTWEEDEDGIIHFISSGRGYLSLLKRTIIYADAGGPGSRKYGKAETVAKEWVDEQTGPGAGARARQDLTIETDAGQGPTIQLERTYKNLYDVIDEVALVGGGDFDIVGTGPAAFEFRWYQGQRGADRQDTVLFAKEQANMEQAKLVVKRSGMANAVLVGGAGEGADRLRAWREDATSEAESPWGRRELFADARNEQQDDEVDQIEALNTKGDALLRENRKETTLTFQPVQMPSSAYGLHYFLGDLVTARFRGTDYPQKIDRIVITSTPNDGNTLEIGLADV